VPEFDMSALSNVERSRLITRVIAPRAIAFVSTLDKNGRGNLAPFSYFTGGGQSPASCVFSATRDRHGSGKNTLANVEATGEYVINVVTRAMAERVNQASFEYPAGTSEFDVVGFTRAPSVKVKPPRVAESPVALECRVFKIVPHGEGPGAANYVIGEILLIHAADSVCTDGLPDETLVLPVARMGADRWLQVTREHVFAQVRPTSP
jgi:flavin reductase (DIM6/NTAB) family NADH-FMN oxidoreductase RutF